MLWQEPKQGGKVMEQGFASCENDARKGERPNLLCESFGLELPCRLLPWQCPSILGITEGAFVVAAPEANENRRASGIEAFALNGCK
jgi:hypothetical protein